MPFAWAYVGLSTCFCRAGRGIAAEYFMRQSSMLSMKIVMMVSLTLLELKCEYMAMVNLLQAEGDI